MYCSVCRIKIIELTQNSWDHLLKFLKSFTEIEILKTLKFCGISHMCYEHELSLGSLPIHCAKRFALAKLLKQYKETGKELRALIFVKTRIGCKETLEFLQSEPDLKDYLKVDILLGKSGMTSNQQNTILDNFRQGIVNTLISTSVAEEGLDVPACSLVIRLDGIETTKTMIQSRGRARSANSEFYCIHHSNSVEASSSYGKYQTQEQKMIISIGLLTKSEKIHPDVYYRKLHLQNIGLKQMVISHIFEYIWNSEPIYKVEETILKLFEFTENTNTQSTVLTLTCEKLFGVKPIFQVVKVGHLFFVRILIKLNNYDRSMVEFGLQAASYFVLTSSSMFKSKQDAKNAASLEVLRKFLDRDLAIFLTSSWTEIYKERYKHTIIVDEKINQTLEKEINTNITTRELQSKYKGSTIRITDKDVFMSTISNNAIMNALLHHCNINYRTHPTFSEQVVPKLGYVTSCTVEPIGTVQGDPHKGKKESKRKAVVKMCETIFQTCGYFDAPKKMVK